MWLPSLYITDNFGNPISGLTINDIVLLWYDLSSENILSLPENLSMVEDQNVPGLYRISGFPEVYSDENTEIVVKYDNRLIATLVRNKYQKIIFGNVAVKIKTVDIDNAILSGVSIIIMQNNVVILDNLMTNSQGEVNLFLSEGTYLVYCYKLKYVFDNPYTLNAVAPSTELNIQGKLLKIPQPLPDRVVIYGYIYNLNGEPLEKANIKVSVKQPYPQKTANLFVSSYVSSTFTDKNGYFELVVLGGAEVEIDIPSTGYKKLVKLPKNGVIDIVDL